MAKTKNLLLGKNRINHMKNTDTYSYKLAIVATSLVMAYFASGIASIAQATELLKAEPVKQESFISQAQDHLALTFATITIAPRSAQDNAKNMIVMEKVMANKNNANPIIETSLISE
tara:strand:+ start:4717 stop:5067 length:351 start_codon:yes stop_codon:yes gene_type:complete